MKLLSGDEACVIVPRLSFLFLAYPFGREPLAPAANTPQIYNQTHQLEVVSRVERVQRLRVYYDHIAASLDSYRLLTL